MSEQSNKPQAGAWEKMGAKRVLFDINVPIQLTFLTNEPEEVSVIDGVYYKFPIRLIDNSESIIETSAWTLLEELKKLSPLKDKTVIIVKKSDKGKQKFFVTPVV